MERTFLITVRCQSYCLCNYTFGVSNRDKPEKCLSAPVIKLDAAQMFVALQSTCCAQLDATIYLILSLDIQSYGLSLHVALLS